MLVLPDWLITTFAVPVAGASRYHISDLPFDPWLIPLRNVRATGDPDPAQVTPVIVPGADEYTVTNRMGLLPVIVWDTVAVAPVVLAIKVAASNAIAI
jgi:hypothetical protein